MQKSEKAKNWEKETEICRNVLFVLKTNVVPLSFRWDVDMRFAWSVPPSGCRFIRLVLFVDK